MRLSLQDKNELLKAAVRARNLESLKDYVVGLVEAIDSLPDGKADAQAPAFRRYEAIIPAQPSTLYAPAEEWPNGLYQQSLSGDE